MKEVIILTPGPFLKRDYDRFGVDVLKKNFLLKVLDITAWSNPSVWTECCNKVFKCDEYVSIGCKNDFLNFNSKKKSKIVLDFLGKNQKSNWIRKQFKKQNSTFVKFNLNLIPQEKVNFYSALKRKLILFKKPKKLISSSFNFINKKYNTLVGQYNADLLVVGGTAGLHNNNIKDQLFAHCMDYDVYLNLKNKKEKQLNPYAVFLEDNMTHDADYSILDILPPVNESQYFPTLIKFLKKFEIDTGLKVKIAIHPKSSKDFSHLLKDFELLKGNTAEIVKNSSLVLLHASTSMSYAILFNKPVLFLTSYELSKSWIGPPIKNLAQVIDGKLINMTSSINDAFKLDSFLNIDKEKYKNYLDQYLKMPNSLEIPLWEIFTKYISENFKK